jgi:hypothetical protein
MYVNFLVDKSDNQLCSVDKLPNIANQSKIVLVLCIVKSNMNLKLFMIYMCIANYLSLPSCHLVLRNQLFAPEELIIKCFIVAIHLKCWHKMLISVLAKRLWVSPSDFPLHWQREPRKVSPQNAEIKHDKFTISKIHHKVHVHTRAAWVLVHFE